MKKFTKALVAGALAGVVATAVISATAASKTDTPRKYGDITQELGQPLLAKLKEKSFTATDGTVIPYRAYYSPAYSMEGEAATLIVFLHGSGGKGEDNVMQIADQVATVNFLASDSAETVLGDIPYIVIAPQCPTDKQWVDTPYKDGSYSIDTVEETPYLKAVYQLILKTLETENADKDNVMLGGISMGGYGTWDMALRHPETFNAIFPICGGGDPTKAALLKDIKIWTFHCDGDTQVPVEGTREMVAALEAVGADVMYTEYQKAAHNAWLPAMTDQKDPYLLEWLFEECTSYPIALSAGEGGSLEADSGKHRLGDSLRINILPKDGYEIESLNVNGKAAQYISDDSGNAYCEITVEEDTAVEAAFKPITEEAPTPDKKEGLPTGAKAAIAAAAVVAVAAGLTAIFKKKKK